MVDENEVLFQITRKHLNTGMRGFPVGTCRTSSVDPIKGLSYVGYPVAELAFHEPEEIIYLLLNRELPKPEQLDAFRADLRARSGIDPKVIEFLKVLPREGHPMEWLCTGLILLGMTSKTGDYAEDALNVIAWAPELVAAIFRIRSGWGPGFGRHGNVRSVDAEAL
jgi:citrate synthase